jgi:hypothetical protein
VHLGFFLLWATWPAMHFLLASKGLFDSAVVPPQDSPSLPKDMGSKSRGFALFKTDSAPSLDGSGGDKTMPPSCSNSPVVGPSGGDSSSDRACPPPRSCSPTAKHSHGSSGRSGSGRRSVAILSRWPFARALIHISCPGLQRLGPCGDGSHSHACGFDAGGTFGGG